MARGLALLTLALGSIPLFAPPSRPAGDGGEGAGSVVVRGLPAQDGPGEVARIAGDVPSGILHFEILDGVHPIPGRLTFVSAAGELPELFPNVKARPFDLAVRRNVVYTLSGRGSITVPVGRWRVHATRGLEWSLAAQEFEIEEGVAERFTARLVREVDTSGWIAGDFHLHTLTHSGHGDADLEERIISLIGEGVEFAVATDHNHNTDYGPTIAELGAGAHVTAVTGNEVTTPIGHMNAFPLEPDRPVPDPKATDANALFKLIRAEPNRYGITPVIQLNHPRWRTIDYFTLTGLDPVTGESADSAWSPDFDTIEVLNENAAWGYFDADLEHEFSIGPSIHSALQDWYRLLNRGHRYFAVGNSDSHTVHHAFAGYPRNYVQSGTDDPAAIDPAEVARALREGRTFTTTGPFVQVRVNGQGMGSLVEAVNRAVQVDIELQSAPWITLDRARVIVNGHEVQSLRVERLEAGDAAGWKPLSAAIRIVRDSWLVVLVEGDQPLDPIVSGAPRPVRPLAVTNPVWIDAEGGGEWTSPWERAAAHVREHENLGRLRLLGTRNLTPPEEAPYLIEAAREGRGYAPLLAREGLRKYPRILRLSAARASEILRDESLLPDLEYAFGLAEDPYLCIALLRAMRACGDGAAGERLLALLERFDAARVTRYAHELDPLLPGAPVTDWRVIGHFDAVREGKRLASALGPEDDPRASGSHRGKGGEELRWREAVVRERGFIDLCAIDPAPERNEYALAYAQCWLYSDGEREVPYALGTDDGCRLWVNGALVHEDPRPRSAQPLQHLGRLQLSAGWNSVRLEVENRTGPSGFYFRVLSEDVRSAAEPE